MTWLQGILQAHPEIAFFLVLGLGYLFGKLSLGGFKLGAVTGTLLAGVLVGQLGVSLPNEVKQCFFLLFLFAIGFRTGPQFFRGLKSDGLAHAGLAAIVATTGLAVAWLVAGLFGYDAGTAAGLVAGALTESATIGTAMDAIARLDLSEAERTAVNNNIPVAFAVTYVLGFAYLTQVKSQQSKDTFEKAIELNNADPLPRLGLGLAKIREGNLTEGAREIEIAASLDPDNALIRSYLGKAYYEEERDKQASEEYTMAEKLDPLDPTSFFYDAIRKQTTNRPC